MKRSDTIGKLAQAKASAQGRIAAIGKDKSATVQMRNGGQFKYSYADLASCLEAVNGPLSEAGIALFQPVVVEPAPASTDPQPKGGERQARGGRVIATTLLVHGESGEWISEDYEAPIVDATDARSVGSAATYARRYGLLSLLAIAPSEEDDDGEAARGGDRPMASGQRQAPQRQAAREVKRPVERQPEQRQMPDEPEPTQAEKARALADAAERLERDKRIFDEALATGLSREGFHGWVEKAIGRPYGSNSDWTEDDRCHLEEDLLARGAKVAQMARRENLQNSPTLSRGGSGRPVPVE
jgi:hypothetical protein